MADEYQGEVRFGIVDVIDQEFLKLTFNIYTVPQTFYIKDGIAYEMQALSIFYDNIKAFIEKNYLNETKVYEKWPVPTYLVDWTTVYAVYAYRDGLKYYNKVQYDIWEWVKE